MLNLWQQMNIAIHDEDIVTLLVQVNVRVGKNSQNSPPPLHTQRYIRVVICNEKRYSMFLDNLTVFDYFHYTKALLKTCKTRRDCAVA